MPIPRGECFLTKHCPPQQPKLRPTQEKRWCGVLLIKKTARHDKKGKKKEKKKNKQEKRKKRGKFTQLAIPPYSSQKETP